MAAITFYVDDDLSGIFDIATAGSGLGFFGAGGFGNSVAVGAYQDNTYVTDGNGSVEGPQANNVKWTASNSGEIAGSVQLNVQYIPNAKATMNVRFTNDTAVQVQNAELRIYDRSDITAGASGVTTYGYECIHVSSSTVVAGSGLTTWTNLVGDDTPLSLAQSPGISGLYAGNGSTSTRDDTRHDWYVCLSAHPDSIGSKTSYGMVCLLEYL
jgi:hypothetical protein